MKNHLMRLHDNTQRLYIVDSYYMQTNNNKLQIRRCFSIATVVTLKGSSVTLCTYCVSCLFKFMLYKVSELFELQAVRTFDLILRVYMQ